MFFREGKSQRGIERETGVSRKTIKKYIDEYEAQRALLLETDPDAVIDIKELTDSIVEAPQYDSSNRKKRKVTEDVVDAIQGHLDENKKKRERGQSKLQKKKIDIYEALVAEGFDVSYSTVCNTVRQMQNQVAEAFIKAKYDLGDVCEFDWGEVKLTIAGKQSSPVLQETIDIHNCSINKIPLVSLKLTPFSLIIYLMCTSLWFTITPGWQLGD